MAELIANIEIALIMQLMVVLLMKSISENYSPLWRSESRRVGTINFTASYIVHGSAAGRHLICRPRGSDGLNQFLRNCLKGRLLARAKRCIAVLGTLAAAPAKAGIVTETCLEHTGKQHAFGYSASHSSRRLTPRLIGTYDAPARRLNDLLPNRTGETGIDHAANIEDEDGRPIGRLTETMPGKLDPYRKHEVSILRQLNYFGDNSPFATFIVGKRIQHGYWKGIESKKLDGATESLEYAGLSLRFRKRDGFLTTWPKGNGAILKSKAA